MLTLQNTDSHRQTFPILCGDMRPEISIVSETIHYGMDAPSIVWNLDERFVMNVVKWQRPIVKNIGNFQSKLRKPQIRIITLVSVLTTDVDKKLMFLRRGQSVLQ